MAKIKVVVDGKTQEIEVAGEVDFKGMGVIPPSEVDALAARKLEEGRKAQDAVIAELKAKIAEAEAKTTQSKSSAERLATMETTVANLEKALAAEQKAKTEAMWKADFSRAFEGVELEKGSHEVLRIMAETKREADGSFVLANGTKGDLAAWLNEVLSSDFGKRLVISNQKGGAGTRGSIEGLSMDAVFADPVKKNQLREKLGDIEFQKLVMERSRKK